VNLFSTALQHDFRHFNVQNRTSFGNYNRFYQNFVPGAPDAAKTIVALSTYNNATVRRNIFNQSDVSGRLSTSGITHTLLAGAEIGRQRTNNFRNTGFFNNTVTSISVPYGNPTINSNVTYRQSPTDADNRVRTKIAATYVQDQIEFSRYVQVITGLRFDYFDLQFHNNRTAEDLRRIDRLTSPRVGVVLKPTPLMSVYGNYNVSYLPSSGDQFSSLTTITQQVKPEKFSNYEVGVKWDLHRDLSLTTAVYRLDRTNTRSTDPNDPTRIVQTGRTRSDGYEIGVNGRIVRSWMVAGGYAYQDAFIANATSVASPGARVAQVPRHTFSLWNNYQFVRRLGAGLGLVHRADMYASIDNTVILPSYTRADAALFVSLSERMRLQTNIENLFNAKYYENADSNTNISPGAARSFRLGLTARF
jgi:catecholate siderophore receptor